MTLFDSLLLGVIQGLTEFLPVSSSGHLILLRDILGIQTQSGLAFDAILQLGTILAVIVYFRRTIWNLLKNLVQIGSGQAAQVKTDDKHLLIGLVIGTIPALVLGLLLEDIMETTFRNPLLVAFTLIAGSILFIIAEQKAKQHIVIPRPSQSWWLGCFQSLALIPGVSRSGATISGGLLLGMTREAATRFSFLLSFPIIAGSGLKKLIDVIQAGGLDFSWTQLSIGFISSFIIGFICIDFLLRYLKNHTLSIFAWYRITLAITVLLIQLA